jgi:thymidylate kinase
MADTLSDDPLGRLVYFSGVHGSGKSTLIRTLAESRPDLLVIHEKLSLPPLSGIEDRQFGRQCRSFLQVFYQKKMAEENPGKYVLCDRSCYDGLAYAEAFFKLGWMDKNYLSRFHCLQSSLFTEDLKPRRIVFMDPPLDFVKGNIEKRWGETGVVKWREKDFKYLEAAQQAYIDMFAQVDSDILDLKETGLEERVGRVLDWLDPCLGEGEKQGFVSVSYEKTVSVGPAYVVSHR